MSTTLKLAVERYSRARNLSRGTRSMRLQSGSGLSGAMPFRLSNSREKKSGNFSTGFMSRQL